MPDFPNTQLSVFPAGRVVSVVSAASLVQEGFTIHGSSFSAGAVWPAANRAIYVPFIVDVTVTAVAMFIEIAVQSGNCDVGIYDEVGNRLVSMGSTAVGAAGLQTFNIADTTLRPGLYYMAMCVDNVVASVFRSGGPQVVQQQTFGQRQQAVGAVTLPDPATFANPASLYTPVLSIAMNATV
jgi:hypothetical protein